MTAPRVVIVSPTIVNTVKGGGVTMGRLFAGWPIDAIAQIHGDILPPDLTVCREYYSIAGPFYRSPRSASVRRLLYLAAWITRTGEHGLFSARFSGRLARWVERQQPSVVFSQTGSPAYLRLTEEILDRTGAALVLHASDDWVRGWPATVIGRRVPFAGPWLAARVERAWRRLAARAAARLAVSHEMARVYRERYGGEWLPFANAVDLAAWPEPAVESAPPDEPVRALYSGSVIGTNQLDGLRDLARVLATRPADRRWELVVSTADIVPDDLGRMARVVAPAPQADLPAHLARAHVLLLPSVFAEPARTFYELSIPGKVTEYLASGRPILVYAPASAALARSARADGWAEVVDGRDDAALRAALARLGTDVVRRSELSRRARAVARRDHDLPAVREAFQKVIRSAAGRTR